MTFKKHFYGSEIENIGIPGNKETNRKNTICTLNRAYYGFRSAINYFMAVCRRQ